MVRAAGAEMVRATGLVEEVFVVRERRGVDLNMGPARRGAVFFTDLTMVRAAGPRRGKRRMELAMVVVMANMVL